MTRTAACLLALVPTLASCSRPDPDAPPTVYLDQTQCAQCGMIISDIRFAAAIFAQLPDGRSDWLAFDDAGEMFDYLRDHPDLATQRIRVHDFASDRWIDARQAFYVRAASIHTPMATGLVAFADRAQADTLAAEHDTTVLTFDDLE